MANDLNRLNDVLFETLEGVKNGTMEVKKAQTIVQLGNSIVNNAKIQMRAFQLTGGKTGMSLIAKNNDPSLQLRQVNGDKSNKRTEKAYELAIELGHKNVSEAIASIGGHEFNRALDKFIENGEVGNGAA